MADYALATLAETSPLLAYARNTYSQNGEDGIIEQILGLIGDRDGWCVEFGAWDGLHLSNCANLVRNHGYHAVFIEANPRKAEELKANYRDHPNVTTLTGLVGWGTNDNLGVLLGPVPLPQDFDLLSIDIDGNDFHVWSAVMYHQPKIVVIEFNPTIHPDVDWVQPADPRHMGGASLRAVVRLGSEKGYELACVTTTNAIFLRRDVFPRVGVEDNSPRALWTDDRHITHIFTTMDGRVILTGRRVINWHGVPLSERRAQQLPRLLRAFPDDYSALQRTVFRGYLRWRLLLYRRETRGA